MPIRGWPVLFLFGGLLSLGIGFCAIPLLPESIRSLLHRGDRTAEVARLARQLRPDLAIDAHTRFVVAVRHDGHAEAGGSAACAAMPTNADAQRGTGDSARVAALPLV